jgi:hypothetical protein
VGKVYQLTAIDVFTRFAVTSIVLGTPSGAMTARFIHQALRLYRRHGVLKSNRLSGLRQAPQPRVGGDDGLHLLVNSGRLTDGPAGWRCSSGGFGLSGGGKHGPGFNARPVLARYPLERVRRWTTATPAPSVTMRTPSGRVPTRE